MFLGRCPIPSQYNFLVPSGLHYNLHVVFENLQLRMFPRTNFHTPVHSIDFNNHTRRHHDTFYLLIVVLLFPYWPYLTPLW